MKKRNSAVSVLIILLCAIMIFNLAACSKKRNSDKDSETTTKQKDVVTTEESDETTTNNSTTSEENDETVPFSIITDTNPGKHVGLSEVFEFEPDSENPLYGRTIERKLKNTLTKYTMFIVRFETTKMGGYFEDIIVRKADGTLYIELQYEFGNLMIEGSESVAVNVAKLHLADVTDVHVTINKPQDYDLDGEEIDKEIITDENWQNNYQGPKLVYENEGEWDANNPFYGSFF